MLTQLLAADAQIRALMEGPLYWGLAAADAGVVCACCEALAGLAGQAQLHQHSPGGPAPSAAWPMQHLQSISALAGSWPATACSGTQSQAAALQAQLFCAVAVQLTWGCVHAALVHGLRGSISRLLSGLFAHASEALIADAAAPAMVALLRAFPEEFQRCGAHACRQPG